MKAAQLMALAMRPIVVRSMPASRQPALVTELVIEWVMQMTVYATKSIIKFLLAIWKKVFFCGTALLIHISSHFIVCFGIPQINTSKFCANLILLKITGKRQKKGGFLEMMLSQKCFISVSRYKKEDHQQI